MTEPTDLDRWLSAVAHELDVADVELDNNAIHTLLDLARDAAHEVERTAAPLTTFLVGVAVGRGGSLGASAAAATQLALQSPSEPTEPSEPTTEGRAD